MVLWKPDSYIKKNQSGLLSHITQNKFKVDWRCKCKAWNHKSARNIDSTFFNINLSDIFFICLLRERQQKQT